jgi:hypothetical protein
MSRPARDDQFGQPHRVEEVVRNYLDMTKPRRQDDVQSTGEKRSSSEARRAEPRRRERLIDNEGLSLEDGNDFA